jgi:hypothetical protein
MAEFICCITLDYKDDSLSTTGKEGATDFLEYLLIVAIKSGWFGVERISYIPWNPFFKASI